MEDLFDTELVIEASRRMLHRGIDAKCDEALHFIARCRGQQQRRFNEKLDANRKDRTHKWYFEMTVTDCAAGGAAK